MGTLVWRTSRTMSRIRPTSSPICRSSIAVSSTRSLVPLRAYATATETQSTKISFARKAIVGAAAALGFGVGGLTALLVGFFIYDATTYKSEYEASELNLSTLALQPERGGPKNLPVVNVMLDDEDDERVRGTQSKPRLVILGTGWGAVTLLKGINTADYHVTVISPTNYFLFTPLLPSATVGTMELRTLLEPIRRVTRRRGAHYLEARAEDIDFSNKLVEVKESGNHGEPRSFYVPYDKLVISVGAQTNTHGVDGLSNCNFLKTIADARHIKDKIMDNFEKACLPTTPDDERKRLLSFVVCGGGPTGVEFAAELYDMLSEDLVRYFPKILGNEVTVHLIQSRDHILNTYEETISEFAEGRFKKEAIDVLVNSRVQKILPDKIQFSQKDEHGKVVLKELPFGLCLWSTGNALTALSQRVQKKLGDQQTNKYAIETDTHLRVLGTPLGDVYAVGDCSTVQNHLAKNITGFLRSMNTSDEIDPSRKQLTFQQWRQLGRLLRKRFPQASAHLKRLDKLFLEYDADNSGTLDYDELHVLLQNIDAKLTSLPATAQRASSQGSYLARKLNKMAKAGPGFAMNEIFDGDIDNAVYKPYEYRHLGSLAYVGNAAVFDLSGHSFVGGLLAMYLWRSVYLSEAVSTRTKFLFILDWIKRGAFGR